MCGLKPVDVDVAEDTTMPSGGLRELLVAAGILVNDAVIDCLRNCQLLDVQSFLDTGDVMVAVANCLGGEVMESNCQALGIQLLQQGYNHAMKQRLDVDILQMAQLQMADEVCEIFEKGLRESENMEMEFETVSNLMLQQFSEMAKKSFEMALQTDIIDRLKRSVRKIRAERGFPPQKELETKEERLQRRIEWCNKTYAERVAVLKQNVAKSKTVELYKDATTFVGPLLGCYFGITDGGKLGYHENRGNENAFLMDDESECDRLVAHLFYRGLCSEYGAYPLNVEQTKSLLGDISFSSLVVELQEAIDGDIERSEYLAKKREGMGNMGYNRMLHYDTEYMKKDLVGFLLKGRERQESNRICTGPWDADSRYGGKHGFLAKYACCPANGCANFIFGAQFLGGEDNRCKRCNQVFYCSRRCNRSHETEHFSETCASLQKKPRILPESLYLLISELCSRDHSSRKHEQLFARIEEELDNDPDLANSVLPINASCHHPYGEPALILAIREGSRNTELIKLLISAGANPNSKDSRGFCALQFCFSGQDDDDQNSNLENIRSLLGSGLCDVNIVQSGMSLRDRTPIFDCGRHENGVAYLRLLVDHGANVNARDKHNNTPLIDICRYLKSQIESVRILLDAGADVNAEADDQSCGYPWSDLGYIKPTAILCLMLGSRCTKTLKMLIDAGADCNRTNDRLLCMELIETGRDYGDHTEADKIESVKLLIVAGCDPNARLFQSYSDATEFYDETERSALSFAVQHSSCNLVEVLIANGADPNRENIEELLKISNTHFEDGGSQAALKKWIRWRDCQWAGRIAFRYLPVATPEVLGIIRAFLKEPNDFTQVILPLSSEENDK